MKINENIRRQDQSYQLENLMRFGVATFKYLTNNLIFVLARIDFKK